MKRKRYSKKECRERGRAALSTSFFAVILLVGTWIYVQRQLAAGRHAHVCLNYVLVDVAVTLLATWLTWDWVRYRRELKTSGRLPGESGSKEGRRRRTK